MKCECCGEAEAVAKDFREDEAGEIQGYHVCRECLHLNDMGFYMVKGQSE